MTNIKDGSSKNLHVGQSHLLDDVKEALQHIGLKGGIRCCCLPLFRAVSEFCGRMCVCASSKKMLLKLVA